MMWYIFSSNAYFSSGKRLFSCLNFTTCLLARDCKIQASPSLFFNIILFLTSFKNWHRYHICKNIWIFSSLILAFTTCFTGTAKIWYAAWITLFGTSHYRPSVATNQSWVLRRHFYPLLLVVRKEIKILSNPNHQQRFLSASIELL